MKIAITGAGGFLGQTLLVCLEKEHNIVAFTSRPEQLSEKVSGYDNILVSGNDNIVSYDFGGVDCLINCAFPMSEDDGLLAEGLRFVADTLKTAALGGVGSVINISSQSVYSRTRQYAADENAPVIPESKYAVAKYAAELLTNTVCCDIPHTNLRLASLIGVYFDKRLVNKFVKKVINGEPLRIVGGTQQFGFMDVRDAAGGISALLCKNPDKWAEVYNLGQNGGYTLIEIAHMVQKIGIEQGFAAVEIKTEPSDNVHNSMLDCSLFQKATGWKPGHKLENTIRDIFNRETGDKM